MDTNPEIDVAVGSRASIGLSEGFMSFHGAPNGVDGATELGQYEVPSGIGYAAAMGSNQAIEDGAPLRQSPHGSDLVGPDKAAISLDVSCENGDQPALYINHFRQNAPLNPSRAYRGTGCEDTQKSRARKRNGACRE